MTILSARVKLWAHFLAYTFLYKMKNSDLRNILEYLYFSRKFPEIIGVVSTLSKP